MRLSPPVRSIDTSALRAAKSTLVSKSLGYSASLNLPHSASAAAVVSTSTSFEAGCLPAATSKNSNFFSRAHLCSTVLALSFFAVAGEA